MWAHSFSEKAGQRHGLAEHLRSTSALARQFAAPFGAGELAAAAGLLHDAGKASCTWQQKLLTVEGTDRPVGCDHKALGSRLLVGVGREAAMTILGHHGGLTDIEQLRGARRKTVDDAALTTERLFEQVPEAREIIDGPPLVPARWRRDALLLEMGIRMVFSALVDADHLDTAAHFRGLPSPQVAPPADMTELVRRFEESRHKLLADRPPSPIDDVRSGLVRRGRARRGWSRRHLPTAGPDRVRQDNHLSGVRAAPRGAAPQDAGDRGGAVFDDHRAERGRLPPAARRAHRA